MVRRYLAQISEAQRETLKEGLTDYLIFRDAVDAFQENYFRDICNRKCYQSKLSACCSRDGIIIFFAEVIINALMADPAALEYLQDVLTHPHEGFKMISWPYDFTDGVFEILPPDLKSNPVGPPARYDSAADSRLPPREEPFDRPQDRQGSPDFQSRPSWLRF